MKPAGGPWWLFWPLVSSMLKVTGSSAGQGSGNQSRSMCMADTRGGWGRRVISSGKLPSSHSAEPA